MRSEYTEDAYTFYLEGRIDSTNAADIENEIMKVKPIFGDMDLAFDAEDLEYISSAGLRVLLKVKKMTGKNILIKNVSDELYEIFNVTGFGNIFRIERRIKTMSIRGLNRISTALNGEIFQLIDDNMIKVCGPAVSLADVRNERSYAQTALACGIPTLIPYEVVRCEHGYGIVYEMGTTDTLASCLKKYPENQEIYAVMLGKTLKDIHSREVPTDKLPNIKNRYRHWIDEIKDISDSKTAVFSNIIDSIADKNTYVHGDINLNSVIVLDGELLLMDMAGSAYGNPLFDLVSLYGSLVGIGSTDDGYCRRTYGLSKDHCLAFWETFFNVYMDGNQDAISSMTELLSKYFVLKENVLMKVEEMHKLKKI